MCNSSRATPIQYLPPAKEANHTSCASAPTRQARPFTHDFNLQAMTMHGAGAGERPCWRQARRGGVEVWRTGDERGPVRNVSFTAYEYFRQWRETSLYQEWVQIRTQEINEIQIFYIAPLRSRYFSLLFLQSLSRFPYPPPFGAVS